jgi:hypothetical protein
VKSIEIASAVMIELCGIVNSLIMRALLNPERAERMTKTGRIHLWEYNQEVDKT